MKQEIQATQPRADHRKMCWAGCSLAATRKAMFAVGEMEIKKLKHFTGTSPNKKTLGLETSIPLLSRSSHSLTHDQLANPSETTACEKADICSKGHKPGYPHFSPHHLCHLFPWSRFAKSEISKLLKRIMLCKHVISEKFAKLHPLMYPCGPYYGAAKAQ